MKKVLLSLGGYDPTSGAGTVLDVKVFQDLGFHGMGIVTALTAQNTQGVDSIHNLPPDWLRIQFLSLNRDVTFAGIKVGMVGGRSNIHIIKDILSEFPSLPRVVDPVFLSSSGTWLLDKNAVPEYLGAISGCLDLLTPNTLEASLIAGHPVTDLEEMKPAAKKISTLCQAPVLIKGGHLEDKASDMLYDGQDYHIFEHEKIGIDVHGTGCLFSSSLLAFLSRGKDLKEACRLAVDYALESLKHSESLGRGQRIFSFLRNRSR